MPTSDKSAPRALLLLLASALTFFHPSRQVLLVSFLGCPYHLRMQNFRAKCRAQFSHGLASQHTRLALQFLPPSIEDKASTFPSLGADFLVQVISAIGAPFPGGVFKPPSQLPLPLSTQEIFSSALVLILIHPSCQLLPCSTFSLQAVSSLLASYQPALNQTQARSDVLGADCIPGYMLYNISLKKKVKIHSFLSLGTSLEGKTASKDRWRLVPLAHDCPSLQGTGAYIICSPSSSESNPSQSFLAVVFLKYKKCESPP